MRRRHQTLLLLTSAFSTGLFAAWAGCSATPNQPTGGDGGTAGSTTAPQGGGGSTSSSGGNGGEGASLIDPDGGGGGLPDVPVNPCGTGCGPVELCDPDHLGLDDDCDEQVDEGCDCSGGQAHFCFKGDPSYYNTEGCFAGTEKCTENGQWGPCIGGVHATAEDQCFLGSSVACHPISAVPFQDVNLKDGTGTFSVDAVPGSEVWTVTCPPGVTPCPAVGGVAPSDDFKPLQSGEYTVTYTKDVAGGGMESCTYPLFVGAPGLRVEMEWEHDLGDTGVDLDLHVHQPLNTDPWSISGEPQDCTWSNCTIDDFEFGFGAPDWFSGAAPPDPVDWYLDPTFEKNTCYFAPRGVGAQWQAFGQGCHNPRLDLDNITCDPTVLDVEQGDFCAPENVNVDFPPKNQWFRVGVHYYSSHSLNYDVHPRIKIYCDGALAAELGPMGYYDPSMPITFTPSDGSGFAGNRFWLVADVAFKEDSCNKGCVVKPLYANEAAKTPLFTLDTAAEANFGPDYPPPP